MMPPATAVDYTVQPFEGSDIVAVVLAVSALLCLLIRFRDREPGMGWFGFSMGSLALWVAFNRQHLPTGPELNASPWWYVMCAAQAAMGPGLVAYLGVPSRWRLRAMLPIVAPSLAFGAAVAWVSWTGAIVPRAWLHGFTALAFTTMAALVLWAHRREPTAGHPALALAFLAVPVLALTLMVTGTEPVAIRYWAVLPVMLIGVTLPSVSLTRRQRALQLEIHRRRAAEHALSLLNQSLEGQVTQRTADLQDMVAGLESFNRSVSHDLRGPLGGIAGLARVARQRLGEGVVPMVDQALGAIAEQADSSSRLVAALLELARVGESDIRRQRLDPAHVAREVIEQIRVATRGALPRIEVHPMPTLDTDPELLRAVLANLIGNAVKFTPAGDAGHVEIGALRTQTSVDLYVRDNGIGFDKQTAATLFQPFRRGHGREFEGHGVGLSIVRRAVERLGGRVSAASAPGQGARFEFTLPQSASA
jgi:signal transduction histidine kinase